MNQIKALTDEEVTPESRATFETLKTKIGKVPNMYRVMANSTAVLESYFSFNMQLNKGKIGAKLAEKIALAVAEHNNCSYCLSAHTYFGSKVGLTPSEMMEARTLASGNFKDQACYNFIRKSLQNPQGISPADKTELKEAGFTDGEVLEIIANIARNIFTNYVNAVADTEVDWPQIVEPLKLVSDESE
nr:carboxymuconolactone decarboxylase family protein [uncultured Mucilaginibacter sp.]